MKVFISADMEGIAGKVHWEFSRDADSSEWDRDRRILTEHVKAAIDGARDGGATEIVVNDSHNTMRNLLLDGLNEENVELITGQPKPLCMMEGIDDTFSAAFLVGYHGMSGSHPGVLNHSFCPLSIREIRINGKAVGELGVNAGIAGYFHVPITLVVGDNVIADEAISQLGEVEVAIIKEALNMTSAKCLPLKKANDIIREKARMAIERREKVSPLTYRTPTVIEVDFFMTNMADAASLIPGTERTGGTIVSFTSEDFLQLSRAFQAMFMLGEKVRMELSY
jgi:D-amino peptidase